VEATVMPPGDQQTHGQKRQMRWTPRGVYLRSQDGSRGTGTQLMVHYGRRHVARVRPRSSSRRFLCCAPRWMLW